MADIQEDLDRLPEWGDRNPSTRTDAEPSVWEGRAPCSATGWGELCWKGAGTQQNKKPQQLTLAAEKDNGLLSCVNGHMVTRSRAAVVLLSQTHLAAASSFGASVQERYWPTTADPSKGHHNGWGQEHSPFEERSREQGLFSLDKRGLLGDLTTASSASKERNV